MNSKKENDDYLIIDLLSELDVELKKELNNFRNLFNSKSNNGKAPKIYCQVGEGTPISLKLLVFGLAYDTFIINVSNKLINIYLDKLFSFKNNIDFSSVKYEVLLKILINCYDIVRNSLYEEKLQVEDYSTDLSTPYPLNLLPEIKKSLNMSFKDLDTKEHESSHKTDGFNSLPIIDIKYIKYVKKIIDLTTELEKNNNFIKHRTTEICALLKKCVNFSDPETYDFTGHATKNLAVENGQGILFFEFTPSPVNRKIYIFKSLSKANTPLGFIDLANLIFFYYYVVKSIKGIKINNSMNTRNYEYIMDTELLFIGDGCGYYNGHNKWKTNLFFKKNIIEIN